MNRLKTLIIAAFTAVGMLAPLTVPAIAIAQSDIQSGLCGGANLQAPNQAGDCTNINDEASEGVNDTVNLIINIFSWVVGVVSVIMIIYGGFRYITSGGDAGSVTSAKNTILYAIVGLIIVALAQVIVKFVLGNVANTAS
ncbi:MAG TPA: pilin [Candidatus Saccharibacteria bacterium]|nr:pilin [Candidatus Saccharibacteria bacterium]